MKKNIALYPGSFDPLTNGHLDIITRSSKLFDEIIIIIAKNTSKKSFFTELERQKFITKACKNLPNIKVEIWQGLVVNALEKFHANKLIRGLRTISDFEYETNMSLMNQEIKPDCETIFLFSNKENSFINSKLIKEIALNQGNIDSFIPKNIAKEIYKKIQKKK